MKINSTTMNTAYLKGKANEHLQDNLRGSAHVNYDIMENDTFNKINTTVRENSDGRLSFKGANAPLLHKVANFVGDSPLVAEAIFAILITCGLRPLTIMATANTEKEKEKCAYQAGKSISSGIVGLGTTLLIGTPIAAAAKRAQANGAFKMTPEMKKASEEIVQKGRKALCNFVSKNRTAENRSDLANLVFGFNKLVKGEKVQVKQLIKQVRNMVPEETAKEIVKGIKEQQTLKNFSATGKNIIDKLFQPVFMPIRAMITIAMVPIILNLLNIKKPSSKKVENINNQMDIYKTMLQAANNNNVFKTFLGDFGNENK